MTKVKRYWAFWSPKTGFDFIPQIFAEKHDAAEWMRIWEPERIGHYDVREVTVSLKTDLGK